MTEAEIRERLNRMYAAFDDRSQFKPEDFEPEVHGIGDQFNVSADFRGGRSADQLKIDAASVINEIMGIRDRARSWLKNTGRDPRKVDNFVKSELAVALVHDLANTDKHGQLDGPPFSGCKPKLKKVNRATILKYDPLTGTYATEGKFITAGFNIQTGELIGTGASSNVEVVLVSDIVDEAGNKVGELHKVLPDSIHKWEQFLSSEGLTLS